MFRKSDVTSSSAFVLGPLIGGIIVTHGSFPWWDKMNFISSHRLIGNISVFRGARHYQSSYLLAPVPRYKSNWHPRESLRFSRTIGDISYGQNVVKTLISDRRPSQTIGMSTISCFHRSGKPRMIGKLTNLHRVSLKCYTSPPLTPTG